MSPNTIPNVKKRRHISFLSVLLLQCSISNGLSLQSQMKRQAFVKHITSSIPILVPISSAEAQDAIIGKSDSSGMGLQGRGGSITRVEGIGGGFDLTNSVTEPKTDVIYPESMMGIWSCRRSISSVEGDIGQAEIAWKLMGGTIRTKNDFGNKVEDFQTRFIPAQSNFRNMDYTFDGEIYRGVVLDRAYEISSRLSALSDVMYDPIVWDPQYPDSLSYPRDGMTEITVVQRKIEIPTEKGFGFNELSRITSSSTIGKVQRAVRVQRRYRRGYDQDGNRIVEGLEIMKTYRVLDGIAGIEMPTSTTKSQILLTKM